MHSTPATTPTPVICDAPGASPSYIPSAASGESSRNGVPGSSSSSTRSRGSSLPRERNFATLRWPPPARAWAWRSSSSPTRPSIHSRLRANSAERVSICDSLINRSPPPAWQRKEQRQEQIQHQAGSGAKESESKRDQVDQRAEGILPRDTLHYSRIR